jgi:hypothetical protein
MQEYQNFWHAHASYTTLLKSTVRNVSIKSTLLLRILLPSVNLPIPS